MTHNPDEVSQLDRDRWQLGAYVVQQWTAYEWLLWRHDDDDGSDCLGRFGSRHEALDHADKLNREDPR